METSVYMIVAFVIGYCIGSVTMLRKTQKDIDSLDDLDDEEYEWNEEQLSQVNNLEQQKRIMITIEVHDGTIFIYNADTGKYMAHGKTHESVKQQLVEKFPDTIFGATEENIKILETL